MILLSLFGGMECGRIVLDRMGIVPDLYYSAEIDKFAKAEVAANYPDVIQLGDVTRWREWDIPWADIDLVIGGSPCQGFSFAGNQLAFDDPRSVLFFEYVNILNHVKTMSKIVRGVEPWFMLENVRMAKKHLDVITSHMAVEPVYIDSALVCAQTRKRYYWCNWSVPQPSDRGIMLVDILEDIPTNPTFMSESFIKRQQGRKCLVDDFNCKASSLSAMEYVKNGRQGDYIRCHVDRDKARALTTSCGKSINPNIYKNGRKGNLVYYRPASMVGRYQDYSDWDYRKLTVVECCRLQGVPDDYFKVSSNTQAYKMLGNGWQCDTIEHIYNYCPLFT